MNVQHTQSIQQIISMKEMNELKSRSNTHLAITVALILLALIATGWFSAKYIADNALTRAANKSQSDIDGMQSLQRYELTFLKNIVFQLASDSELQRLIMNPTELSKDLILDNWTTVAEQLTWISQIRFIANSGFEILRVDYDPAKGFAEPKNIKQNKKDQDYFKNSIGLKKNELHISRINLNREYNEISYPITPVIRFVMPVFQPTGQASGFIVVNFLAEKLIMVLSDISANSPGTTLFLDDQGNYLQGYSKTQNWSHELTPGNSERFSDQQPQAWQEMQQKEAGNLLINGQRFIYRSFNYADNDAQSNRYTVLQHITDADVRPDYHDQYVQLYLFLVSLFVLSVLAAWSFFKNRLIKEIEHNSLELISVLFNAQEAIVITNLSWHIEVVNQAFCDVTGHRSKDVEGSRCDKLYFFETAEKQTEMKRLIAENGHWFGEVQSLHQDGSKATNLMLASSVKNQQGNITHYVLQLIDISERKAMEDELKIAAAAFNTRSAITITDATGSIIKVNQAFTDITGYSQAEVFGKNPRILSSGRHDEAFYKQLWETITEQGYWQGEIWNKHKDGNIFPEWISISSIKNSAGVIIHYVATFEDITERKSLESQIEKLSGNNG